MDMARVKEQARRTGRVGDDVLNAPQLEPELMLYWVAYCDLSTCRSTDMGVPCPLPWTAVNQYSTYYEFDEEQDERLHYFVGAMDKAFMEWSKQQSESRKRGNVKKPRRIRP